VNTTDKMTEAQLTDLIMNLHHEISNLRIAIAFERSRGSDRCEDTRLQEIAEIQHAIQLFIKDLDEVRAGA